MRRFGLLTLVSSIALAGCVAGPPPEIATDAPTLPDSFALASGYVPDDATSTSIDALLPSRDPALQKLWAASRDNAPSLAEALARVEAARAAARGSGANRKPQVNASGSLSGSRTNPDQFGAGLPAGIGFDTERVSFGSNLTASWDPDIFGVLKASERAALARVDAASASAGAVEIAITAEIAGAVIDWRTLSAREEALLSDLSAAQRLAQLAGSRERAGLAPGFDRLRAEAAANSTRTRLTALQSERAQIVGRLVALTGKSGQFVLGAFEGYGPGLRAAPPVPALPSELLTNRPDVLAAAANLAASDAQLTATARQRFPRLTLSAALGLLAFDLGGLFDTDAVVGDAGGSLLAPILDFGRIEAQIDGAAAEKRVAFAGYRGAVFQALGEAETAYGLIAATDLELVSSKEERALLDRTARLANTRYSAGLTDFSTVLEARRAADASGEREAAARGRAARARVLLWQTLGGRAGGNAEDQSTRSISQ
ncbi:MAG: efflux transporter outer membrane subunit [Erythrobacter sp.]